MNGKAQTVLPQPTNHVVSQSGSTSLHCGANMDLHRERESLNPLGGGFISIYVRFMNGHKLLWVRKRLKPELRIKPVSVSRRQQKAPQSLQVGMRQDGAHKHLRNAAAAVLRHDKDVRNIGYRSKICNHSGKAGLLAVGKRPKA